VNGFAAGAMRAPASPTSLLGIPSQPELTAVAEQVRFCVSSNVAIQLVVPTHVNSIRRWVVAKLQGVSRASAEEVASDFRRVFFDGPGPTLETLGDVYHVGHGYYLPTPPLAIPIASRAWILVSGFPSASLPALAPFLRLAPVGRLLVDIDRETLRDLGIGEMSIERYAGVPRSDLSPVAFLESLIRDELTNDESRQAFGATPYSGEIGPERGFNFVSVPRRGVAGPRVFELWRDVAQGSPPSYLLLQRQGRVETTVNIDPRNWRRVALAIDVLSGHRRSAVIRTTEGYCSLDLDCELPLAEYRLLLASGAVWATGHTGRTQLLVPTELRSAAIDIIRRCWIDVRG
jgi:hypothetical protein